MTEQTAIPAECLQLISHRNKTGCLIATDPKNNSIQWQVYCHEGQINYATSLNGQRERLTYLGQQFQTPLNFFNSNSENAEYREIYNYWLNQKLPIIDLQKLYLKLTQETLVQVSALERSSVQFLPNHQLQPAVISYSWQDFSGQFRASIHHWKQLRTEISSPFNRLCLDSQRIFDFYKAWQTWSKEQEFLKIFGTQTLSKWLQSLSQKMCLYEIATQMQVYPLTLALKLQPLVKIGAIQILPFEETTSEKTALIVEPQEVTTQTISPPRQIGQSRTILPPPEAVNRTVLAPSGMAATTTIDPRTRSLEDIIKQNNVPAIREDLRPLIVCVDDSKTVQQQVTRTLEMAGYQIISITEPASALAVFIRQKPALILLDINMPEINGYELCQMLNRSRKLREIPVVMITAREGLVDRLRAKFIGVSEYLTKPFDANELIEVVQRLAPLSCSI